MTLPILLFSLVAAWFPSAAGAAEPFANPQPGRIFKFPADHGAHPEFKTEWWYWVGHLKSPEGEAFGYQITFFRTALRRPDPRARSAWSLNTVYFAHLAVTDPARGRSRFREKVGRGALGISGATADRLRVWIDDWQARQAGEGFHLQAGDQGLGLDLVLTPLKPPALHGEGGFSPKAAHYGAASYYYSIPRLDSLGHLPTLADQEIRAGVPARVIYWEGQVQVQGRKGPRPLNGMGYVELTGYAGAMEGRF